MFFVMIRLKVPNYAKWKRTVKSVAKWPKASGAKCLYACRSSKNPNDLLVWCKWEKATRLAAGRNDMILTRVKEFAS